MKAIITLTALLFSFSAFAENMSGYVKKLVDDDEGTKIILVESNDVSNTDTTKILYLKNTQTDFQKNLDVLKQAKIQKNKLNINKENKILTIKSVGQ